MAGQPSRRKRILFVDDDPEFLETVGLVIDQKAADLWQPFFAESAGKALSLLQDQPVDLVVIDVQMPVVDGIQFLNLVHRKHPRLQKVVLTGYASDEYRSACLSGGAELFLEKPRTPDGLESILATLYELSRLQPEEGFRGMLRKVELPDILQMECLSRHSVVLVVSTSEAHGEIFIRDGNIVHAQIDGQTGEAAFNRVLTLTGGEFDLQPFRDPPEESIEGQWEFLLMEAARMRDEAAETAAQEQAAQPASDPMVPVSQAAPVVEGAPDSSGAAAFQDHRRRTIEEIFICSNQGEVIYEWQCRMPDRRMEFLDFIARKSLQLGQLLNLGQFDRVELTGRTERFTAQIQSDCGIVIRSSRQMNAEQKTTTPLRMAST